jgi:hypothetical protein
MIWPSGILMLRLFRGPVVGVAIAILAMANARALEPERTPVPVFVAEGASRTGYQPSDRQLAQWALDAWARNADGGIVWQASPENDAVIRLYWSPPRIQAFGETQPIDVHGQRGSAVFVRADTRALGNDLAALVTQDPLWRDTIVYLTCVHELGHALGLEHTRDFGDIMYSFQYGGDTVEYFGRYRRQLKSRSDIPSVSGLSVADVLRLRALHR